MKCKICGPLKKRYCQDCGYYKLLGDYEYGMASDHCDKQVTLDSFTKYDTAIEHVHYQDHQWWSCDENRKNNCKYWKPKYDPEFWASHLIAFLLLVIPMVLLVWWFKAG
jgi:hypothetical protein